MTLNQNWYIKYKDNPHAKIRLFCFHHSGGGASAYFPWVEHLSSNIELIAIQLPGRENRYTEPLTNNLNHIVSKLKNEFCDYKEKPFFIFGHSLGALIGYEFIKSVHQQYSIYPRMMIASAAKAPHLPYRMKRLSQLKEIELKKELRSYNGLDELILKNDELFELFVPIIKNDFSIGENYVFSNLNPFPFDILTLSGIQDLTVTEEETLAWSLYTSKKFQHLAFLGQHFFIKEHQKRILEIINQFGDSFV